MPRIRIRPAMTPDERLAVGAGWASLAGGLSFVVAPSGSGALVGLRDDRVALRLFGVGDLVVGGGLLLGRDRARWVWARAVWNLVLVALCGRALVVGTPRAGRAAGILALMGVLGAVDGRNARRLRAAADAPGGGAGEPA